MHGWLEEAKEKKVDAGHQRRLAAHIADLKKELAKLDELDLSAAPTV